MNTVQIENCLKVAVSNTGSASKCLGAIPKDEAIRVLKNATSTSKFCFIANTHTADKPGEHWVAYYYSDNTLEFFDSYGNAPTALNMPYRTKFRKRLIWNTKPLQSWNSDVCGQYCVYYLFKRCRNIPMCSITLAFNPSNAQANDYLVSDFVCRTFRFCLDHCKKASSALKQLQFCVTRCRVCLLDCNVR